MFELASGDVYRPAFRPAISFLLILVLVAFSANGLAASTEVQAGQIFGELEQVEALLGKGQTFKALRMLDGLQERIAERADPVSSIHFLRLRGLALRNLNQFTGAINELEQALELSQSIDGHTGQQAVIVNDLGLAQVSAEQYFIAQDNFLEAYRLSALARDHALQVSIMINLARLKVELEEDEGLAALLSEAARVNLMIDDVSQQIDNMLGIGLQYRNAQVHLTLPTHWRKEAFGWYQKAHSLAKQINDEGRLMFANGYLGQLYEDDGKIDAATQYTRKALFTAQSLQLYGPLYRWEWQLARLLLVQGDTQNALKSYRQALHSLAAIKSDLTRGSKNTFEQVVRPIYNEYIDALLRSNLAAPTSDLQQSNLRNAQSAIETLHAAEVEDYFENECVLENNNINLANLRHQTAVMYTVLLDDRIDIIVEVGGRLFHEQVKVSLAQLTNQVRNLRNNLEIYNATSFYKRFARNLYDWLVRPVEPILQEHNVETIVFVPDGPLRSIPMAVLHDGDEFLIEKYAIATTPGMNITSGDASRDADLKVLALGISDPVQGFSALPKVENEVASINANYQGTVLLNESFVESKLADTVQQQSHEIVHIATHGEFDTDYKNSFLLTYDEKLNMSELENLVRSSGADGTVDLLVLSACQTAKGDDRAALGLAGVAIKAGAKSALATLWTINDDATLVLISEFYQQLKEPGNSKSQALRKAQLKLIAGDEYAHPAFWSAFLLIGNWL